MPAPYFGRAEKYFSAFEFAVGPVADCVESVADLDFDSIVGLAAKNYFAELRDASFQCERRNYSRSP